MVPRFFLAMPQGADTTGADPTGRSRCTWATSGKAYRLCASVESAAPEDSAGGSLTRPLPRRLRAVHSDAAYPSEE